MMCQYTYTMTEYTSDSYTITSTLDYPNYYVYRHTDDSKVHTTHTSTIYTVSTIHVGDANAIVMYLFLESGWPWVSGYFQS